LPSPPAPLPERARGGCPHRRRLSQGGRGEVALTAGASPRAGEGSSPHPRRLSQGGRGEVALTAGASPKAGEGRLPLPPAPLPGRARGGCPYPRPLSQGGRGEVALTPGASPRTGEERLPSPPAPLPRRARGGWVGDEGETINASSWIFWETRGKMGWFAQCIPDRLVWHLVDSFPACLPRRLVPANRSSAMG